MKKIVMALLGTMCLLSANETVATPTEAVKEVVQEKKAEVFKEKEAAIKENSEVKRISREEKLKTKEDMRVEKRALLEKRIAERKKEPY